MKKELRIGNLVTQDGNLLKVNLLSNTGTLNYDIGCDVLDAETVLEIKERISPIPLTEDWLLKFGFEMKTDISFIKDITLVYYKNGKKFTFPYFHGGDRIVSIKYVHSLQNLYFALTGKELEYGN